MLDVAVAAAKEAGEVIRNFFEMTGLEREVKDDKSFVTTADREAEAIIISALKEAFPDHGFIGEEGTDRNADARFTWVVDPLDGTNNFVNGIPLFAISIALIEEGRTNAAVVYNPVTRSLYTAQRDGGMYYNGKRTGVSTQTADSGMISFGPGKEGKKVLDTAFAEASVHFRAKRYLGATALELAYVARGGTEAFVCLGLKKWDYAAGTLLVEEAGGTITGLKGEPWTLDTTYFAASNGVAHSALLKTVASFA